MKKYEIYKVLIVLNLMVALMLIVINYMATKAYNPYLAIFIAFDLVVSMLLVYAMGEEEKKGLVDNDEEE